MNKIRRTTAGLAATALAGTAALTAAPSAQAAPERDRPTSLAQVLAADGHRFDQKWGDFDILDAAVAAVLDAKPKSPVAVLAKGRTELTAFLPTDRAFRHLAGTLTGTRPDTEKRTFKALAGAAGIDTIETVLLYHVVPGKTLGAAKVVKADGKKLTTAQGGKVTVMVKGKRVSLGDADPDLRDPRVTKTDINRGNPQIAHVIDRVLLPIDL
ncbi:MULTISPECIES: fasciclin domain-containing protein [unclassified Nocardioides]|uniref:fasciclin domain-containing protein n=1 Tax=unclassified Nocardioides TaxID=2615069 RepID=UPI00361761F1